MSVPVLALGRVSWIWDNDNIPIFVTPRMVRFSRRRVSGIHIPADVGALCPLPLSTPIERTARTAVRGLWD
jgi:hypothetical protein